MGMQVPCSVDTEMPEENALRPTPEKPRGCVSRSCPTKGESGVGRAPTTRPCAYADLDTTEICGIAGGRLNKREERDPYSADIPRPEEEL